MKKQSTSRNTRFQKEIKKSSTNKSLSLHYKNYVIRILLKKTIQ